MKQDALYYSNYLQLDAILNSQKPASFEQGCEPAHDEMLFIVIHQAYELWFKQVLFELNYVMRVFGKQKINDNSEDLNLVRHRLSRVIKIMELLNQQVHILDTMTPLDFLAFRNLLTPSSGFQSKQFRLIEAKLGLGMQQRHRHDYYKRTNDGGFTHADFDEISNAEAGVNLQQLVNQWLERMPFFEEGFWQFYRPANKTPSAITHPFWADYHAIYLQSLTEKEKSNISDFDFVFFELESHYLTAERTAGLRNNFSAKALRAALFIMLYRDLPVFQASYQILDCLIEIDHALSNWRYKHFIMVRRMIGMRVGTGNTSGAGYLEGALTRHYIYRDLAGLSTYLVNRTSLPTLPEALVKYLSFNMY